MPLFPRIIAWLVPILLLAVATGGPSDAPEARVRVSTGAAPSGATWVPDSVERAEEAERERLWAEEQAALAEAARLELERQAEAERQEAERARLASLPRTPAPAPVVVVWDGSIHAHPWMICTRKHESDSGDANHNGLHDAGYQAIGGGGTFRGAYQFMRPTWDSTAAMAGRDDLIGVDPAEASVADQDQMAWTLSNGGTNKAPWGGRC